MKELRFVIVALLSQVVFVSGILPENKISLIVQNLLKSQSTLDIIVSYAETKEILAKASVQVMGLSHGERAHAVYKGLLQHATVTQASTLSIIQGTFEVKSFWISNQIYVKGADASLVNAMAKMEEVRRIEEDIVIKLDDPIPSTNLSVKDAWGIRKIQAQEAWAVGGNGEGAVVGIIDTGARFTHEAIRESFRGGSHSWFDPYQNSKKPRDEHGHGTHVTGTIAGKFGIGVAPGSKWISCLGLGRYGVISALLACAQFMTCPHDYLGNHVNCKLAPHVVSNSWGSYRGDHTYFDAAIETWHVAGIIPVFAAGNNGRHGCSTVGSPADSPSSVLAVGATNSNNEIAPFSSRGPSAHARAHKPDISAPGVDVLSAGINGDASYDLRSGTSMPCPHVAGLVALLKSVDPNVNYEKVKVTLESTAVKKLTGGNSTCGGVSESEFPNFSFGHGLINALVVLKSFQNI